MTDSDFEDLAKQALGGTSSALVALIEHTRSLRAAYSEYVDHTDTWDEDHPLIGYCQWGDE